MTLLKRSVMTLYSSPTDIYSHQVRIVLAEKSVNFDLINVDANHPSKDLADLNPYQTLPTLVDRDLILHSSRIIMEYLDERFPHPPLLPVYPIARAKCRLMIYRVEHDLYRLLTTIAESSKEDADIARNELKNALISLLPVLRHSPYFFSDDFTLLDCVISPLLWRLPYYGITFPSTAKPLFLYEERIFERESFKASLTEEEAELREELL